MRSIMQNRFDAKGVLIGIFICMLVLSGCHNLQGTKSEKRIVYADNYEITGTTKDEMIGKVHPAIFTTVDRSNIEAKRTFGPMPTKRGAMLKIETGRYKMTGHPSGNIYIYDKDNNLLVQEIVGEKAGVPTLTVDIDSTYSILFDGGYNTVTIEPVGTMLSTELTAGIWDVGLDIEPGDYTISIPDGYGFVQILEQGADPRLFELMGSELKSSKSRVQLQEGQKVRVSRVSVVYFEPVSE
ncbi:hypothetical protein QTL97_08045 [Sporosarcina thermotolerans]|uniref:Uncharacterized protein n=1 Tax=Sporosarcina thermotolerans TaxID=633404 RepID=A0AAW9A5Z4_9BACL|nr:hypothetical protein [Sporosarcina thermotolerans]MDW0116881.1 hypothetical protein [Sporosarcina thermotolerans]WHT47995.1 hypothetical protein QNH10_18345 [Sporosarcina thermotolerans]